MRKNKRWARLMGIISASAGIVCCFCRIMDWEKPLFISGAVMLLTLILTIIMFKTKRI